MPLTSVKPPTEGAESNPTNMMGNTGAATAATPSTSLASKGAFSVDSPSLPTSSLPSSNPIMTPNFSGSQQSSAQSAANSTSGAAGMIGKAVGAIGGSIVGGPVGGAIGGFLGDIFGGLFAGGGPVGYAQGGQVDPSTEKNDALAIGYLVGALHQRDFNGDPQTLPDAANMIKQRLAQSSTDTANNWLDGGDKGRLNDVSIPIPQGELPQGYSLRGATQDAVSRAIDNTNRPQEHHFASGGLSDSQLAQQAMEQALGLGDNSDGNNQDNQKNQNAAQQASAVKAAEQGQGNSNLVAPINIPANQETITLPSGYAQRLDGGGPPMPPQGMPSQGGPPPLGPGQTFQGDGSVKGPGGPTDDAIPAKLSNGEFVMSSPAVQFFGVDKLTKMNEQGKQGFMQAIGQVQSNQDKGPQAAMPQGAPGQAPMPPSMPPQGSPPGMPMMQAGGGFARQPQQQMSQTNPTMRNKQHGYMGM